MERKGLEGIRVLEVAGGVGVAWAAKLFADLGADVIRFEDGDDVVRRRPHDVHAWLNANKRSVRGGAPAGAAPCELVGELASGADIVLHDRRPSRAAALGLTYTDLASRSPALVVCSITPFGMTGPYADYAAEELTVIHGSSLGFPVAQRLHAGRPAAAQGGRPPRHDQRVHRGRDGGAGRIRPGRTHRSG